MPSGEEPVESQLLLIRALHWLNSSSPPWSGRRGWMVILLRSLGEYIFPGPAWGCVSLLPTLCSPHVHVVNTCFHRKIKQSLLDTCSLIVSLFLLITLPSDSPRPRDPRVFPSPFNHTEELGNAVS